MSGNDAEAPLLNWSKLPAHLEYLRAPAAQYGANDFGADRERLRRLFSDAELAELAALADRVRQPEELNRIHEWRQESERDQELFFVERLIQFIENVIPNLPVDKSTLDWNKLPDDLRYLAKPATLYGFHWLSPARHQLIQEMSEEDLIALATLSKHMRKPDEAERIDAWLGQYRLMDPAHPEPLLVRHLIELIDEFIREI